MKKNKYKLNKSKPNISKPNSKSNSKSNISKPNSKQNKSKINKVFSKNELDNNIRNLIINNENNLYHFVSNYYKKIKYDTNFIFNKKKNYCSLIFNELYIYINLILYWINYNIVFKNNTNNYFQYYTHNDYKILKYKYNNIWNNKNFFTNNKYILLEYIKIIYKFIKFIINNFYINNVFIFFNKKSNLKYCFDKKLHSENTYNLDNKYNSIKKEFNNIISYLFIIYIIIIELYKLSFDDDKNNFLNEFNLNNSFIFNKNNNQFSYNIKKMYINKYKINIPKNKKKILVNFNRIEKINNFINLFINKIYTNKYDIIDSFTIYNNIKEWIELDFKNSKNSKNSKIANYGSISVKSLPKSSDWKSYRSKSRSKSRSKTISKSRSKTRSKTRSKSRSKTTSKTRSKTTSKTKSSNLSNSTKNNDSIITNYSSLSVKSLPKSSDWKSTPRSKSISDFLYWCCLPK